MFLNIQYLYLLNKYIIATLEVSGGVRRLYGSLGVKGLICNLLRVFNTCGKIQAIRDAVRLQYKNVYWKCQTYPDNWVSGSPESG